MLGSVVWLFRLKGNKVGWIINKENFREFQRRSSVAYV